MIGAVYSGVWYEAGGGVPILDASEVGLRDSQLLNAAGREEGMLSDGSEGMCRGTEAALD